MAVKVRRFRTGVWEVDIRFTLPSGTEQRQRRKAPVSSKSGAQRWGEDRERVWYAELISPEPPSKKKEVPTVQEFWPRFLEGHARAKRQKPSGIAAKEMIADLAGYRGSRGSSRMSLSCVESAGTRDGRRRPPASVVEREGTGKTNTMCDL